MKKTIKLLAVLLMSMSVAGFSGLASDITVVPDHADGCYSVDEPVTWIVKGGTADDDLPYTVKVGGLTDIATGKLNFADGEAKVTAKLDRPGTLLIRVKVNEKKEVRGGAAIAWPQIKPSAPEPEDFDAFWKEKLNELAAIPANPVLEEVDSGEPEIQLWKITMDNIRGTKIYGYLARPKGTTSLPAMLQLQYAGIYALKKEWVVGLAKDGWLAMNIMPHDLPVDREESFYSEQGRGPLKQYKNQGSEDREKSYFLRMYLSCCRAVDYLAGRSDWNKNTLLVQGGSQGGMQSLAVAGLNPVVTSVTVCVPAGCDQTGVLARRVVGFPWWIGEGDASGREARSKACVYYDPVNFAKRIKCPVLVGMGLIDSISPPEGVFTMFNQIPASKRLVIMPLAEHSGDHAAYAAILKAWWKAAASGKDLPIK